MKVRRHGAPEIRALVLELKTKVRRKQHPLRLTQWNERLGGYRSATPNDT